MFLLNFLEDPLTHEFKVFFFMPMMAQQKVLEKMHLKVGLL